MKAIVYKTYGPPSVLQTAEIKKPVPKDKEILIKNYATTVNFGDLIARKFNEIRPREFHMPGLFWLMARIGFGVSKPRNPVLGSEFSGVIEATGKDVTSFQPGDEVFGYLGQGMRAYAEYIRMPESAAVALKPKNTSFQEASALPYGAIMAISLLKKAKVQEGQKVLINGASGSIGAAAVQIARHLGAEVTGVCGTKAKDFVISLGADHVIDYRKTDFTDSEKKYDLVFDVLGKSSFSKVKNVLNDKGIYLRVSFKLRQLLQMIASSFREGKKIICAIAPGNQKDLQAVKELIDKGKIKAIIDRKFNYDEAAEAHRYVEEEGRKGYVVIKFAHNGG